LLDVPAPRGRASHPRLLRLLLRQAPARILTTGPRARVGAGVSPADPARRPASPRSGWLRARSGAGGMGSPLRTAHPGPQPGRRARRAPDDWKVGGVSGGQGAVSVRAAARVNAQAGK